MTHRISLGSPGHASTTKAKSASTIGLLLSLSERGTLAVLVLSFSDTLESVFESGNPSPCVL